MKLGGTLGFVALICTFSALANAVPAPERIEALRLWRTEGTDGDIWESGDLMERISSMGRLLAHDAHRIYRKSFDGIRVDDLRAMLDQLCDGEAGLWDQLDILETENDSEDSEGDEDIDDGNLFTDLLSQLNIDPESLSTLLSSTDRLEIDGKRMEAMMKLLDQLSRRIREKLSELETEEGGWMRRFVIRQMKSTLTAMLRVIDTIKETIQDAELETIFKEEIEGDVTEEETETEEDDGMLVPGTPQPTDEVQTGDTEWNPIFDEDEYVLGNEGEKLIGRLRFDNIRGSRRKRDTVTSPFNAVRAAPIRSSLHRGVRRSSYPKERLNGGWSVHQTGCIMWTNPYKNGPF